MHKGVENMDDTMEQMALEYFHTLPSGAKKRLMKKIVSSLDDSEKVELAKMIIKK
jgi:hypothetical protein